MKLVRSTYYLPIGIAEHNTHYHRDAAKFLSNMESVPFSLLSNIKNDASNVLDLVLVNELNDVRVYEDQYSLFILSLIRVNRINTISRTKFHSNIAKMVHCRVHKLKLCAIYKEIMNVCVKN